MADENDPVDLTLEELDRDGAVGETLADIHGCSRAEFLRNLAVGSGTLLAALAAPPLVEAGRSKANDVTILNYALNFEYLQSTFYTQAEHLGTVRRMGARKELWARTLGAHERGHVEILQRVLGPKAVKKPRFDFHGNNETEDKFTRTAVAMEDLTVALLTGQTPRLRSRELVAAAFSLLTVEARHAAWARRISGFVPVAAAFDKPKSLGEVDRTVASTRFISTLVPKTAAKKRRPRFTG